MVTNDLECILYVSGNPKAEVLAIRRKDSRIIACSMINPSGDGDNGVHEQGLLTTQSCPLLEVCSSSWEEADSHLIPSIQQQRL